MMVDNHNVNANANISDAALGMLLQDLNALLLKQQRELKTCFMSSLETARRQMLVTNESQVASAEMNVTEAWMPRDPCTVLPGSVKPSIGEESGALDRRTSGMSAASCLHGSSCEKRKTKKVKSRVRMLADNPDCEVQLSSLEKVTSSPYYEAINIGAILLNSMAMRAENDASRNSAIRSDTPVGYMVVGFLFNIIFTVDLGLRWCAEGIVQFWKTEDFSWNCLDLGIVLLGILDCIFMLLDFSAGDESPVVARESTVLRVLRVVRLVKVMRIVRVLRFFRELRLMIFSIMNSMVSLLWVILILGLMFYMFGISFTAAAYQYLDTPQRWRDEDNETLVKSFGTLGRSVVALYMAMSGGNDWEMYYECLSSVGAFYQILFLVFITFALFAVVNIVTGVFVDSALTANTFDKTMMVAQELEAKKMKLEAMREVFEELDNNGNGTFSAQEFEMRISDERVAAYMSSLKLDVSDAKALFTLLDHDASDEVSIDEFVQGCLRLQGDATNLDAKIMQYEVKYLKEAVADIRLLLKTALGDKQRHGSTALDPAT